MEAYRRYRYNLFLVGHNSPVSTVVPRVLPLTFIHHRWQLTNSYPEVSANQARSAFVGYVHTSGSRSPLGPIRSDDPDPARADAARLVAMLTLCVLATLPAQVRLDFSYFEYPNIEVRFRCSNCHASSQDHAASSSPDPL